MGLLFLFFLALVRREKAVKQPMEKVDLYRPQSSKSRIMMAICARLAASAMRVKSWRKMSVEGPLLWVGAGWGTIWTEGDCWAEELLEDELETASIMVVCFGGR
jgi:hypothetical protein